SRLDALEPALEVREPVEALAVRLVRHDPWIAGHVGDRVVAGNEGTAGETLVEHAIEPVGLARVAVDGVGHFLRRVDVEMADLSRYRTEAADLPEQPFGDVEPAAQIGRDEAADLVGEVEQHGPGFE